MPTILVTGGCGYIGSHTLVDLIDNGFEVISVDNLVNSGREVLGRIREITGREVTNHEVDLSDDLAVRDLFARLPAIDGIIHFAALKNVGESVAQPLRYYHNNISSLIYILEAAVERDIRNFIFSSSCSVYGNAAELPVTEETPEKRAESPYAATKQMGERIIQDLSVQRPDMRFGLLRYFNPAGAHPSGKMGESPSNPAQSLAPVITETALGKRKEMVVFGDDYPTRDGSCVRDYIHIMDLAHAHTLGMRYLLEGRNTDPCEVFNLGIGEGVTVLEAIAAFERVSGVKLNYRIGPRRPGDVVAIYADYTRAAQKLGWKPRYSLDEIMESAWKWGKGG